MKEQTGRAAPEKERGAGKKGGGEINRDTLLEQYAVIEKSLDYMGLSVAALLLNYYTVTVQKEQVEALLEGRTPPEQDLYPLQMSSAVMLLASSSFFAGLSHDALNQPPAEELLLEQGLEFNNLVNQLVLAAAAIRILNLFLAREAQQEAKNPTPAEELEEEELELEDSLL